MKFGRFILAVIGVALCAGSPLDEDVKQADSSYTYKHINQFTQDNCTIYILNMTSQNGTDEKVSNRSPWVHDVMVVVPNGLSRDITFLAVAGGGNGSKSPVAGDEITVLGCAVAKKAQNVSVLLRQIENALNEQITFLNDSKHEASEEDDIIAWTWKMFDIQIFNPYILLHPTAIQVYKEMLEKLDFKRDRIVGLQEALQTADMNVDKQTDFDEWRRELKRRGYSAAEIEMTFATYDVDGDRILDEEEQRRMFRDLYGQRVSLDREYSDVEREALSHIVSEIEEVLAKLEEKLKLGETLESKTNSITESDGTSDEMTREQMARLVRDELERWNSETSIGQGSEQEALPSDSGNAQGDASVSSGSGSANQGVFDRMNSNNV